MADDKKVSIAQWLINFDHGAYEGRALDVQIKAGWYDWFCGDKALAMKTQTLAPKVRKIAKSKLFDADKCYVWFKNNCPVLGTLYDDFRIADIETGNTLYTITPHSGHTSLNKCSEVWSHKNDWQGPVYRGDWKGVLNFFGVK